MRQESPWKTQADAGAKIATEYHYRYINKLAKKISQTITHALAPRNDIPRFAPWISQNS